jgi:hypothetical protein
MPFRMPQSQPNGQNPAPNEDPIAPSGISLEPIDTTACGYALRALEQRRPSTRHPSLFKLNASGWAGQVMVETKDGLELRTSRLEAVGRVGDASTGSTATLLCSLRKPGVLMAGMNVGASLLAWKSTLE